MAPNIALARPTVEASFVVSALALLASLVLGGGTRSGFLADAALQLLAVPLLLVTLVRWSKYESGVPGGAAARFGVGIGIALIVLLLVQLIPLPPGVWSRVPGREPIIQSFAVLAHDLPWMPLSVAPHATWLALLSLIPIFTVFLATMQTSYLGRRALCLLVVGFGAISVILGLLQVAQGPTSPLRPFEITNPSEAVGFFANRNHYAALLYSALLLIAPWAAIASATLVAAWKPRRISTQVVVAALACFTVIVMLVSAQGMARSRAGLGLSVLAIIGALVLPLTSRGRRDGPTARRVMLSALLLALVFVGQFALYRILERFDADPLADARIPYARNTIEAAVAYMPFGSGVGTFVPVYGFFEKLTDLHSAYANRAHNDILEAWLEGGVAGIALFAVFAAWFLWRTAAIWSGRMENTDRIDLMLARAATLVIALLLAHSLADYPLRTGAMAGIFAFCCALMIPPPKAGLTDEAEATLGTPARRRQDRSGKTEKMPSYAGLAAEARSPSLDELQATPPTTAVRQQGIRPEASEVINRPQSDKAQGPSHGRFELGKEWPSEWQEKSSSIGGRPRDRIPPKKT